MLLGIFRVSEIHQCKCWTSQTHKPCETLWFMHKMLSTKSAYGWRKFWNIHARSTETDRSGKPLWGLHSWWSFFFSCWRVHCFWKQEVSRDPSASFAPPPSKYAPIASIWLLILHLRLLYKKEIVWRANRVCIWGSNSVAAWKADTTVCISSKHWLYLSSTWVQNIMAVMHS